MIYAANHLEGGAFNKIQLYLNRMTGNKKLTFLHQQLNLLKVALGNQVIWATTDWELHKHQ
jgi:hypothetical protein